MDEDELRAQRAMAAAAVFEARRSTQLAWEALRESVVALRLARKLVQVKERGLITAHVRRVDDDFTLSGF